MKSFFRDYFIPHEGNDLRPRFFHWETAVIVFSVALFLEILFLVQIYWVLPATNYSANILPGVVISLTNQNREVYQVPVLKSNELLTHAAQLKAEDMVARGYFSHQGPEGETPWTWLEKIGYDYISAGENLAVNFTESEDMVSAWMNSESHKQNIISGRFTEIGIGIAKGLYEGREAIFVVQFFGKPSSIPVASPGTGQFKAPAAPVPQEIPKAPQSQKPLLPDSEQALSAGSEKVQKAPLEKPLFLQDTEGKPGRVMPASLGLMREFFSQPHRMVNYLYFMMLTMIALAFCLMVFVRIRVQHPRLLLNGAMMLLLVGSLIVFNHYFMLSQIKIL